MEYGTLRPWQEINENAVIYAPASLLTYFPRVCDPRQARGKRYHLTTWLVIIFLAKLSGQNTPVEIADWVKNQAAALVHLLKPHATPQHPAPGVPEYLGRSRIRPSHAGLSATTRRERAATGDGRQDPPGFGTISTDFRQAETVNTGHGRIEQRRIQTSALLNDYLDWPSLGGQVYRLERRFTWIRQGKVIKTSQEVESGITSLTREKAWPQRVMQVRRQHWLIETGLHYRRDVTLREDATRMTKGGAERILATIRNVVLALIRQAGFQNAAQGRRWFNGHIDQAFALLTAGNPRL